MTEPSALNVEGRDPNVAEFAAYFQYQHLADEKRMAVSAAATDLAAIWLAEVGDSRQLVKALDHLLAAKDCIVRAVINEQNRDRERTLFEQRGRQL